MTSTPVVGNEIDGAVDFVEFDGEPKPGGESKTMLVMPRGESSVTRGDQMALVSGTPWTKTLVLWGIRQEYTYI